MKSMTWIALILSILLCVVLVACGNDDAEPSDSDTATLTGETAGDDTTEPDTATATESGSVENTDTQAPATSETESDRNLSEAEIWNEIADADPSDYLNDGGWSQNR